MLGGMTINLVLVRLHRLVAEAAKGAQQTLAFINPRRRSHLAKMVRRVGESRTGKRGVSPSLCPTTIMLPPHCRPHRAPPFSTSAPPPPPPPHTRPPIRSHS